MMLVPAWCCLPVVSLFYFFFLVALVVVVGLCFYFFIFRARTPSTEQEVESAWEWFAYYSRSIESLHVGF